MLKIDNERGAKNSKRVNESMSELTTAFYGECVRRMLVCIDEMTTKMRENANGKEYFPDIFHASSSVIADIFEACGIDLPDYVRILYYNDYSHDDFTFLTLPAWAKENQSLTEATRSTKEYLEKAAGQRQVNGISVPAVMEEVPSVFDDGTPYVRLAILCANYLASKNPDVRLETSKKRDRPVFVFQGKAQRINIKPYTVGENAAKEYKKNGEGKTPRWRHYWCGNGRERRECKFIY